MGYDVALVGTVTDVSLDNSPTTLKMEDASSPETSGKNYESIMRLSIFIPETINLFVGLDLFFIKNNPVTLASTCQIWHHQSA
jgi:hypothetical protein